MPIIHIDLKAGRTLDQKRALVREVTKAVCDTVGATPSAVRVILNEMSKEEYALEGILDCDREKK